MTGLALSEQQQLQQLAADYPGWRFAHSGGRLVATCLPLTCERLDPPDGRTMITAPTVRRLRAALAQTTVLARRDRQGRSTRPRGRPTTRQEPPLQP